MKKEAYALAKDYDLGNEAEDFYQYILDSLINGQRQQVRDLFNKMEDYDKREFLINFLNPSIGHHKSTLNTCIQELTPKA